LRKYQKFDLAKVSAGPKFPSATVVPLLIFDFI